jgi:hypothetical protein
MIFGVLEGTGITASLSRKQVLQVRVWAGACRPNRLHSAAHTRPVDSTRSIIRSSVYRLQCLKAADSIAPIHTMHVPWTHRAPAGRAPGTPGPPLRGTRLVAPLSGPAPALPFERSSFNNRPSLSCSCSAPALQHKLSPWGNAAQTAPGAGRSRLPCVPSSWKHQADGSFRHQEPYSWRLAAPGAGRRGRTCILRQGPLVP